MGEFFQDYLNIGHMREKKREYRQMMERADRLPDDYAFVFRKIQKHMWKFASGAGYDMMEAQRDLLELFEEGAASGRNVLEITGEDVAGFTEELLKDTKTWTQDWKRKMNSEIQRKVGDR